MRSSSSRRVEGLFAARVLLFAAVAAPLLLRFVKLPKLRSWLEPARQPRRLDDPAAVADLVNRIDAVLAAGHPFVRSGCLTRGFTLYYFLRRAGADVSLRFGMGKTGESLSGHCWLVFAGEPLAERRDPRPIFAETWAISPGLPTGGPAAGPPAAGGER